MALIVAIAPGPGEFFFVHGWVSGSNDHGPHYILSRKLKKVSRRKTKLSCSLTRFRNRAWTLKRQTYSSACVPPLACGVSKGYHSGVSSSELTAQIQAIDSTVHTRCHCGTKAKWTASLRLDEAQIEPRFQHEDLCEQHAEQFAAVYNLRFPRIGASSERKSKRQHG